MAVLATRTYRQQGHGIDECSMDNETSEGRDVDYHSAMFYVFQAIPKQ